MEFQEKILENKDNKKIIAGFFKSVEENANIYYRRILLKKGIQAPSYQIYCLHDLNFYHKEYEEFSDYLSQHFDSSMDINLMDFKGHGLSTGVRNHIEQFSTFPIDLASFINMPKKKGKIILIGVGLGALAIMELYFFYSNFLKHKISGIVLINPIFEWNLESLKNQSRYLNLIKNEFSKLKILQSFDGRHLTRDPLLLEKYNGDSLIWHQFSFNLLKQINKAGKRLVTKYYYMDLPTLFYLSEDDPLADKNASLNFLRGLRNESAKVRFLPGAYHDILIEKNRGQFYEEIHSWIKSI